MTKHPIPDAALDDRQAFVGTSGSGKTHAACTCVERLLHLRARVVVVDPLDVWWGLRLKADGAKAAFPVVIFGGAHGDLPITEQSGALIGETVATMAESCVVSLAGLGTKAAERRFMLAFLEALYRKAPGEPFHIVFDEADLWAPQRTSEPQLQSLMEQVVRRGRVKGFIPWLITQRPAVLSKDVLSQADGLVAMKLTSSQDRDAIAAWIEGQADRADEKRMLARLPQLERGAAVVWIPGRGILEEVKFPPRETFDSSRTPKRGEAVRATALKPIDLGAVKARLARVEEEAGANDPKRLRAEIAHLKRQLAASAAPGPEEIRRAAQAAFERGREAARREAAATLARLGKLIRAAIGASGQIGNALSEAMQRIEPEGPGNSPPTRAPAPRPHPPMPVVRANPAPNPAPRGANGHGSAALASGERKCLTAIAQHPGGVRRETLTVLTGYKRSSRDTYIQRLRSAGLVEIAGDRVIATPLGVEALGPDFEPLPTGEALRERVLRELPDGERRVLEILIDAYPRCVSREQIDIATGYKRSSRDTYLQRLRLRELVEARSGGEVRASDNLFETHLNAAQQQQ